MSKITNDGLTRSDTGCFIAEPVLQQWASKGQLPPASITVAERLVNVTLLKNFLLT